MPGIWVILPPWFYALAITLLGRWGASHWFRGRRANAPSFLSGIETVLFVNLVFLSLLPLLVLLLGYAMLPFEGANTGLALGLAAFLFGCVPARLLDAQDRSWDETLWCLLIDLLRTGGAFTLTAWLVLP